MVRRVVTPSWSLAHFPHTTPPRCQSSWREVEERGLRLTVT